MQLNPSEISELIKGKSEAPLHELRCGVSLKVRDLAMILPAGPALSAEMLAIQRGLACIRTHAPAIRALLEHQLGRARAFYDRAAAGYCSSVSDRLPELLELAEGLASGAAIAVPGCGFGPAGWNMPRISAVASTGAPVSWPSRTCLSEVVTRFTVERVT